MADAAAAPPDFGAGERLAAALQGLGDALSLEARAGRMPEEVQELVGSWDARTQALVGAVTKDGLLQEADAAAAAQLLLPLLGEGFVADYPDLFKKTLEVGETIARCCSDEAFPSYFGPVGASFLGLFPSEQLSPQARGWAARPLLCALPRPGCAAAVLAAAGGEGTVDALIAAAIGREGYPPERNALLVLAAFAHADAGVSGRAASDQTLLPFMVDHMRTAAAGAASCGAALECRGVLRLLGTLIAPTVPPAARAAALATPGLAAAAADLLVALGSQEWAAVREEWEVQRGASSELWEELEAAPLAPLLALTSADALHRTSPLGALTSRGALPRLVALLRSPHDKIRVGASSCIASVASTDEGRDALFLVPRATSELAAALRRARLDGEDPALTQFNAAFALARLLDHRQRARVADGLASAAMAEGSAGPLLGALAGLFTASVAGGDPLEVDWQMFECASTVASFMAVGTQQLRLRPVLQRSPLAGACVRALAHWLPRASDEQMHMVLRLVGLVGILAGFDAQQAVNAPNSIFAATADTAATRAALREAPGMAGALRRFIFWAQKEPVDSITILVIAAATYLLGLPELQSLRDAAANQAAAAAALAVAAAAGPASAAPTPPLAAAAAAAAAAPLPAAASRPAERQARDSTSGDGGFSGEAAVPPRACGGCLKSKPEVRLLRCSGCKAQYYCGDACARADWRSHRAACKAAARCVPAARRL